MTRKNARTQWDHGPTAPAEGNRRRRPGPKPGSGEDQDWRKMPAWEAKLGNIDLTRFSLLAQGRLPMLPDDGPVPEYDYVEEEHRRTARRRVHRRHEREQQAA